jgi:glycosyltransferase involved in cell wall biosynthesis
MIDKLCVVGHPSYCGGADTELLDQIKCWNKMGIKIYICHTGPISPYLTKMDLANKYGCIYLKPRQWYEVQGMHCISFCNGEFLSYIRHIRRHAKTTTFVNCMTWNFQKEIQAQHDGLIDFHLYQTEHGLEKISKNLKHLGTYRPLMVKPFFDVEAFPYHGNRLNDHFRFGRISRCDITKFSPDQLLIYDSFECDVPKSGVILGWDFRIKDKYKVQSPNLTLTQKDGVKAEFYKNYIQLFKEGGLSQQKFYEFCDVLILSADTFENLPRIGMEAMSSGSVMIVNNRGGWKLEVEDGKTGFLCDDTKQFIDRASILAKNLQLKEDMRGLAREKLLTDWGLESSMKSWEQIFNEWEKLR